jgi:hypothetical protein
MCRWLTLLMLILGNGLASAAPNIPVKSDKPTEEQFKATFHNLKHIGLAVHNYVDALGHLPTNIMAKKKPLLSWRVQLLPYFEDEEFSKLYKEFHLDESWDSEHNKKLIDKIPQVYVPVRNKNNKRSTYYQMFVGQQGLLKPDGAKVSFGTITDGVSNTLLVVEAASPVIWTKPDDVEFNGTTTPSLGGLFPNHIHAVFCDGYLRRIPKSIDPTLIRRAIDPDDDGGGIDLNEEIDKAIDKANKK